MNLLAVDTASRACSVAVLQDAGPLAELNLTSRETHSKHLMRMVAEVMHLAKLQPAELDGFAVSKGPGSFTGLRIGISAVKGLAMATGKPAVGVSTLEALAWQFPQIPYPICAMLDARRGEVYQARFRFLEETLHREAPDRVAPPLEIVAGLSGPCLFVGDGALAYRETIREQMGDRALFAQAFQNEVRAAVVGLLGSRLLETEGSLGGEALLPVYLRKSDAEINRKGGYY